MHGLLGVSPNLLEELWTNKMELSQNGHFYGFWVSSSNSSRHWVMVDKKSTG